MDDPLIAVGRRRKGSHERAAERVMAAARHAERLDPVTAPLVSSIVRGMAQAADAAHRDLRDGGSPFTASKCGKDLWEVIAAAVLPVEAGDDLDDDLAALLRDHAPQTRYTEGTG